ncbi:MAG: sulfurtransferase complex subunit TusB [Rhodobacteraceae bacterium]|nr:sulfurtransferase complex subunit TusB [Paracoccaceae bacterium]
MATLHTVNKSPFQNQTLISCLGHTKAGDAVLMFEDGVYGATKGTALSDAVAGLGADVKLYALGPDLAARGIDAGRLADGITLIDYDGFVDLVAENDRTQNWL